MVYKNQEPKTMTNNILYKTLYPATLLLLFLASGCLKQSLPLYHHTLNTPVQPSAFSAAEDLPIILVGPVRVASFLDQGHLVSQTTDNSVALIEHHRWAGNLSEMLSNALISRLTQNLGSEEVYGFPNTVAEDGLRLELDFLHFEQDQDQMARVTVRWKILSSEDQSIHYARTSHYRVQPEAKGYDDLVQALSQGLSLFSEDITAKILLSTTSGEKN